MKSMSCFHHPSLKGCWNEKDVEMNQKQNQVVGHLLIKLGYEMCQHSYWKCFWMTFFGSFFNNCARTVNYFLKLFSSFLVNYKKKKLRQVRLTERKQLHQTSVAQIIINK